jgi:hypothetical protein
VLEFLGQVNDRFHAFFLFLCQSHGFRVSICYSDVTPCKVKVRNIYGGVFEMHYLTVICKNTGEKGA